MGGTLSNEQKEPYCSSMTGLYLFSSEYWNPTLDCIMVVSAIIATGIVVQIAMNKHL